ncbi:pyroglutamyl-peptidase I [Microbacterium fluvii]|uniref:Pyroglutamyl-peptidase I n=1 Tax=Microbacterium fluvii TaxID=415215 RepID=A0ABW2HA40_9MICO|nr:pyroglutamyl-peptidase I [Microbacterium fluvii]MCU4671580.1 pyroglutamyl-peptidase I [Microbacterium fluvii]
MTTVLLTGFEPFGGDAANPSGEAVRLVAASWAGPETLITDVLPVTFAGAAARMRQLIAAHSPDVIVAAGLAGGRRAIGVERIAVNLVDARIPDNDGAQPIDEPSVAGAENALFSTLPVKAIAAAIGAAGIPAEVSHTAGTFVCNHVFFTVRDAAPIVRGGFVHVPWAAGQGRQGDPELPLGDIARALEIAVRVSLDETRDLAAPGGSIH